MTQYNYSLNLAARFLYRLVIYPASSLLSFTLLEIDHFTIVHLYSCTDNQKLRSKDWNVTKHCSTMRTLINAHRTSTTCAT